METWRLADLLADHASGELVADGHGTTIRVLDDLEHHMLRTLLERDARADKPPKGFRFEEKAPGGIRYGAYSFVSFETGRLYEYAPGMQFNWRDQPGRRVVGIARRAAGYVATEEAWDRPWTPSWLEAHGLRDVPEDLALVAEAVYDRRLQMLRIGLDDGLPSWAPTIELLGIKAPKGS